MMLKPFHISDQRLIHHMDRELSSAAEMLVRAHLAQCRSCRARLEAIESAAAEFAQLLAASEQQPDIADGPRALLKARLAELSRDHRSKAQTHWTHPLFARNLAYACSLALLIAIGVRIPLNSWRQVFQSNRVARSLPDPDITPGSTRQVSVTELCSTNEEVVRDVPGRLQQKVFEAYGLHDISAADFEVDYLITPGLGGSEDVRNLWPEPHANTKWNSLVKDQLEHRLHHMVCNRTLSLDEAQKAIATNWIAAYQKYFSTDQPLADPSPLERSELSASEEKKI